MSASDWTMQFLADMLNAQVDRPEILETTALGAGYLAGWQAGSTPSLMSSRRPGGGRRASRRRWRQANANPVIAAGATPSPARFCDRRSRLMRIVFRCDPAIEH